MPKQISFEEVYEQYFHDIYRYILSLSQSHDIAEEITSDTFFKAMRAIEKFRGECDIRVWLCQIAKNCYCTYLKKQKHIIDVENSMLLNIEDSSQNIEQEISDRDEATQLRKLLHEIPQPYQEVFMWRVFASLNFKQIGQIFHKTDNWACVTYHRARAMLRQKLEEQNHEK